MRSDQKFKQTDEDYLQRPRVHCQNALKTTPVLETLVKHLDSALHLDQDTLSRLTEFQRVFDKLIKSSGVFCPLLQFIRDMYTEVLSSLMVHSHVHPRNLSSDYESIQLASVELLHLKKKLHQLEVESRVILQENDRLMKEYAEQHCRQLMSNLDMAVALHACYIPCPVSVGADSMFPAPSVKDYARRVENLQLLIAKQHASIAEIAKTRKGRIPLSVCHQLEQCSREAEIEIKKQQRHRDHLNEQIQNEEVKSSDFTFESGGST